VETALAEELPRLEARASGFPALHRPATFIETALRNLVRRWQSVHCSSASCCTPSARLAFGAHRFLAIPLSLLAAVVVLDHFNVALNTLTLGGFAVALGCSSTTPSSTWKTSSGACA
jgi:hypothetical protein